MSTQPPPSAPKNSGLQKAKRNPSDVETHRIFPTASQDADRAENVIETAQTRDPSYRLAFQDNEFLLREDLRPVRFQLELLKPELLLREYGVTSTIVFYGSARIPEPEVAAQALAAAQTDQARRVAERVLDNARYYDVARELARLCSQYPDTPEERHYVVVSGGGPSMMEAANRGADDVGAPSVGLNIVLPMEQAPNPYITPALSFRFHYFALRKMHFLMRARAVAVFPGGYGTLDELFETLCLMQTGKIRPIPVLLFGKRFWNAIVNFEALADEGVITRSDLGLFRFVETAEEAWEYIQAFHAPDVAAAE